MPSHTTGQTVTMPVLGDPYGLRPAQERYNAGLIGEYLLENGHLVWCQWMTCSKTNCHIVIWDENGIVETLNNINRLQAARETEKLFIALES
jgi:hypothetical protein